MSPFVKIMQLFLMMSATVLGMLLLLLITPDLEDSMLRAVRKYQKQQKAKHNAFHTFDSLTLESHILEEELDNKLSVSGIEVDHSRKAFNPWPHSPHCSKYRVHFARQKSLPMTALISFPGSGNTWLRYLIETASGVFTGSMYVDRKIISKGFYGEAVPPDCGCTAVQKTHGFALEGIVPHSKLQRTAEIRLFQGRGILLLRNPYEALLSYRNFLYGGHTGFAPHSRFKGQEWENFASQLALVWRDLAATWINYTKGHETIVLHFELLRNDPKHHLSRLLDFLGISVDDQRLGCVFTHIEGPFHRPKSMQNHLFHIRDPFSVKIHKILDSVIQDLDRLLEKRGWQKVPKHLYKFYKGSISPAVSSTLQTTI